MSKKSAASDAPAGQREAEKPVLAEASAEQEQQAGVTGEVSDAGAAAGFTGAGTSEESLAVMASDAGDEALAAAPLSGTTVDGGGTEERVVLVDRYAFFGEVKGKEYHMVAARGDVVKLSAEEAQRGESLGALAAKAKVEQAQQQAESAEPQTPQEAADQAFQAKAQEQVEAAQAEAQKAQQA